ncbi:hypothetical protein [Kitasatospora sp. NPDC059673]|uniref:hypothetical protein n=1 Tax=Kitasatospora sp. NPDC059673 TaxID=3346901 RepID=UPI0036A5925F
MDRFDVLVPDEGAARAVAVALSGRGHREVAVQEAQLVYPDPTTDLGRRVDGWWHVVSLVDDEGLASGGHFGWERVAVNTAARAFGGYGVGYGTRFPGAAAVSVNQTALVRELDASTARALRCRIVAEFPPEQEVVEPETALEREDTGRALPPLGDAVRGAAHELHKHGVVGRAVVDDWLSVPSVPEDDHDVLIDLVLAVMADGACDAGSALHVPLLEAVALRADVSSAHRAVLITCLSRAVALTERLAAADADRLAAHGLTAEKSHDEAAVRRAVEAAAPSLLAEWESADEAVRFALAGLAAITHGAAFSDRIRSLAGSQADGPRREALLLAAALSQDAAGEIDAALSAVARAGRLRPFDLPSPLAPQRAVAVDLLIPLLEREASRLLM